MIVIRVENLKKTYQKGKIVALDNLSFSVRRGEIFSILGPNGAGKTTALKILAGIIDKDSGRVNIEGRNPGDFSLKKEISFLPENFILPSFLKVKEVIDIVCKIRRSNVNNRLIDDFSLEDILDEKIRDLSQGKKRILQIVLSLIGEIKIFIWDEPTVFLDVPTKNKFIEIVRRLKEGNKTIIISSHILSDIERLSERALFLKEGRSLRILSREEFKDFGNLEEAFLRFYEY